MTLERKVITDREHGHHLGSDPYTVSIREQREPGSKKAYRIGTDPGFPTCIIRYNLVPSHLDVL
jgi:hypothetical protein